MLAATTVAPYHNLRLAINSAQASDWLATNVKCWIVSTLIVGDCQLLKTREPGGPGNDDKEFDMQ